MGPSFPWTVLGQSTWLTPLGTPMQPQHAGLSRVAAATYCQVDSPLYLFHFQSPLPFGIGIGPLSQLHLQFHGCQSQPSLAFFSPKTSAPFIFEGGDAREIESMSYNLLQSIIVFSFSVTFLVSQSSCSPLPRLIEISARVNSVLGAHPEEVAMADVSPFQGVHLHHVARETSDVNRMVEFYQKVFGFQKMETPQSFGDFNVTWLHLPPIYQLHVVERDPKSRLPESPFVVPSDANADVSALWRGPHLSFRVSDYDAAIDTLKTKDIKYFEKTQQEGKVKQCFFFDPDGNGLEIGNWPVPK